MRLTTWNVHGARGVDVAIEVGDRALGVVDGHLLATVRLDRVER